MPVYLAPIGLAILIVVVYDFVTTTLATAHSGPLSLLVIRFYKVSSIFIYQHLFHNRLFLAAIGPLTVVSILFMWLVVTWLGWVLIFFATATAVESNSTGSNATIAERIYFVGFLITTLGMGDFVPTTGFFRVLSALAAVMGFVMFGIAATWLLNISQASANTRILATQIASAGYNPAQLLINAWDGETFSSLSSFFSSISSLLAARAQQEIFLPVLINFHPYERDAAEMVQIPVVDEAITLLLFAIEDPASKGIDKFTLIQTRNVITKLLENTMQRPILHESKKPAPIPDLHPLQLADIPVIEDKEYQTRMQSADVAQRRRILRGLVESCGYSWKEVWYHRHEAKKSALTILREQLPFVNRWVSRDHEVPGMPP